MCTPSWPKPVIVFVVFPNNTRCIFSLTLEIKWTAEYSNTASSAYKDLKEKLLKSVSNECFDSCVDKCVSTINFVVVVESVH